MSNGSNSNNVLITDNERVVEIDCDVDVDVPEGEELTASDLVFHAGLRRPRSHPDTKVGPGKYNVRMLAIVTTLSEGKE